MARSSKFQDFSLQKYPNSKMDSFALGSEVEGRLRLFFLVRTRGNIWPSSALQSMQNVWEKTCAVCAALGAMPSSLSSLLPSSFSPTANIFAEKSVNPPPKTVRTNI